MVESVMSVRPKRTHEEYHKLTSGVNDVIRAMTHDRTRLMELNLDRSDPFWRRTFVRQVFAETEVQLSQLRTLLKIGVEAEFCTFNTAEVAVLYEEEYRVDEKGRVQTKTLKISTKENLQFVFVLIGKVLNKASLIDRGSTSWAHLDEAIKKRDKLMHPRCAEDLHVDDPTFEVIGNAASWLDDLFGQAFKELPAFLFGQT